MREKERSTKIIFVRHGETSFPVDRIYCDEVEDPPLNNLGLAQVEQAAESLNLARPAALYVSPSLRTRMTADILSLPHSGLLAVPDDCLRERHFGVWEGLCFSEIERDFAAEHQKWKRDQASFKPKGGESVYDLADRVVPFVRDVVARHRGEVVIVVAHVGPIRVLVAEALGIPIGAYRQLCIDPASITVVDYGITQNNLILMNFHKRHWANQTAEC